MSVLSLALLMLCDPQFVPPSAAPAVAQPAYRSSLPPLTLRNAVFRHAGIAAALDRIGADEFDRDILYVRAASRPADALVRLYPWITQVQAIRLKREIARAEADPTAGCGGRAGR